jgi:hypothetical protein
VTAILCLLIGTGFGYLWAQHRFDYPTTFELSRTMTIVSGVEVGSLPRGTHMYYRSSEHDQLEFYVFVRLPLDQAQGLLNPIETDHYNGHRHLEVQP